MSALFTKISAALLAPILALSGFLAPLFHHEAPPTQPTEMVGSITNSFVGGKSYFLAGSGVTSSASSISLTSFRLPVSGATITMANFAGGVGYGTLEPGSATKQEFISFTGVTQNADGTALLTGVSRGLAPISPYTASTTYQQSHSGGSIFILSDAPGVYQKIIDYVDGVAISGAPDASTLVKGIGELATGAEAAASTATGGSGTLILPASLATSTFNSATAANRVPVTNGSGKIDAQFISTSTLFGSGAGQGLASTTALGSFPAYSIGKNMQVFTSTGTSTFAVPSGISKVTVQVLGAGGGGDIAGGGAGAYSYENVDITGTTSIQVFIGSGGTGGNGAAGIAGTWSTFGTNGFYLSAGGGAPGTGTSINNCSPGAGGTASGGDINISGNDGTVCVNDAVDYAGFGGITMYGKTYGNGGNGSMSGAGATGANGLVIIRW